MWFSCHSGLPHGFGCVHSVCRCRATGHIRNQWTAVVARTVERRRPGGAGDGQRRPPTSTADCTASLARKTLDGGSRRPSQHTFRSAALQGRTQHHPPCRYGPEGSQRARTTVIGASAQLPSSSDSALCSAMSMLRPQRVLSAPVGDVPAASGMGWPAAARWWDPGPPWTGSRRPTRRSARGSAAGVAGFVHKNPGLFTG